MRISIDGYADLELALLRRGMIQRAEHLERCESCGRTPLVGERVYVYDGDTVRCELCRTTERTQPVNARVTHGPEFGHTIRIADRRAA